MDRAKPLVSVITATYNRSNVLRYAIESLRQSHFADWEQIVVGDGCTDDTEAVVHSFADTRISFVNLPENSGDEAVPHNEGFRRARGRYIAYLNHDDLWLPDHLDTAVRGIETSGADLVFTLTLSVSRDGPNELVGVMPGHVYTPVAWVPQSAWLLRRELLEQVGPWRPHTAVWSEPPLDLLIRAWRAGKSLRSIPSITVIKLHAGRRPGVYARREHEENREFFERMQREPDFLQRELLKALVRVLETSREVREFRVRRHLYLAARNLAWKLALKLRIAPLELRIRKTHKRRGAFIDQWRRKVGLPTKEP